MVLCKSSRWPLLAFENPVLLCLIFLYFKATSELKEKPAIEENAFEALEKDFQEVPIQNTC